jgi:hypothetical protein
MTSNMLAMRTLRLLSKVKVKIGSTDIDSASDMTSPQRCEGTVKS